MTQPTPETSPQHQSDVEQPPGDDQPTVRLQSEDPEATRPMSLADLLNSD
jgi:hypothetical protein